MRRTLAVLAALCFLVALLELLTSAIRHNVLAWLAAGLLVLAIRATLEGLNGRD